MNKNTSRNLIIVLFIFLSVCALFWQFFIKGLYPYPGNYMLAWFEPFKSEHFIDGRITLPHKAVADDVFRQLYPFQTLAADVQKQFQLPLWNPYEGAGMPLLATHNIGFLDPLNILYLIISYPEAWTITILLQAFFIGLFTYLYCRKLEINRFASLFGSIIFLLSGFVTVRLVFGMYGTAIAMLPLILYLIESFIKNPKSKVIYLFPFAVFTLLVSTQPQISLYILIFSAIYFIYRSKLLRKLKTGEVINFIILSLIGLGLSLIQLLPTLELYKHTNINQEASISIIDRFLVSPFHVVSIFIPNYFGNLGTYNYWGTGEFIQTIASIGLIPCLFAFIAFFEKKQFKKSVILFFSLSTIISVLLAIDWIGTRIFYSIPIPLLSTGAPSRIFILSTFSISILAAYGLAISLSSKKIKKIILVSLIFTIVAVLLLAITFVLYKIDFPCPDKAQINCYIVPLRNSILEIGVFGISLVFFFVYLFSKEKNKFFQKSFLITILLIVIIGVYNANKFIPYSPRETFYPANDLINKIKEISYPYRVFGISDARIPTNFATYFKFYGPEFYHPLYIQRYREFINFANTGEYNTSLERGDIQIDREATVSAELKIRRKKLFDILGIKYIIYKKSEIPITPDMNIFWKNDKWYMTENINVPKRAYATNKYKIISNSKKQLELIFDENFDPSDSTVLEEKPGINIHTHEDLNSHVEIQKYKENTVILETNTNQNSILVLSDNYYPGWKAYVDQRETKIYRANFTFRAIELPEGNHTVVFSYEPESVLFGTTVSIVSLSFLGIAFLINILRPKIGSYKN